MAIYELDPIKDTRWQELLLRHPDASVFHRPAWLEALRDTYGYESLALTTSAPGQELKNGIVFCQVKSWLTGSRLVSLPFADHCQPLVNDPGDLAELLGYVWERYESKGWKYIEFRPLVFPPAKTEIHKDLGTSAEFCFHQLDLRPSLDSILRSFHRTSIQQTLKRGERAGIGIEEGRSERLLRQLYDLLLLTRRRQHLPPQPLAWFRNLVRKFGEDAVISIASQGKNPVAGILTLRHGRTAVYKYGCSDATFNRLGGTPLLLWRAIQGAKESNATVFDFGRSELDNSGLITFKDRWGTTCSQLTYYRYARHTKAKAVQPLGMGLARKVFSALPDSCLTAAGRLLYRHIG